MSMGIDLYEDDHIGISANMGYWGVRLSVDQKKQDPKNHDTIGLVGDLLTKEKLETLIQGLQQVKKHLDLIYEELDTNFSRE